MTNQTCLELIDQSIGKIELRVINFEECDLHSILNYYQLEQRQALKTNLGKQYRTVTYFEFEHQIKQNASIKIWSDKNQIIKIDLEDVIEMALADLKRELGSPAVTLDYYFDVILMEKKVWIYPEKGIAIFLGMSPDVIYKVSYFPPSSLEHYENHLHSYEIPREFER